MASSKKIVLAIALLCVVAVSAYKEDVRKILKSCKNGQEVTDEELEEFIKPMIPKNDDEKCLMACAMRSYNIINGGVYDPKIALAVTKEVLKDDPEKAQKIKEVIAHCGDDVPKKMDNECELAHEIMQCYVKYEKADTNYEYYPEEPETEPTGPFSMGGLTLSPMMIVSGGKLVVKFLINGVTRVIDPFIPGAGDIANNWVNNGFGLLRL